jgi:tRNA nucleotidyltransferase/poly(A) polymerase
MTLAEPQRQREFAVQVVGKLRSAGFEALWAGGCVRDRLLGCAPKDYDVATNARPEQIREVFGRRRTLAIGEAFGVITVLGPSGAGQIEVATFRQDANYSDGRHPDSVTFCTAEADAKRRDFTINGLFFDPVTELTIDYVGGEADLQAGMIRAIGDAELRFSEDKLRMLRAVRFAARFDFELELQTAHAIQQMAAELAVVSAERIAMEMRQILVGSGRCRAVELLRDLGLFAIVFARRGDLPVADDPKWQLLDRVLAELDEPSFALALAAVLTQMAGVVNVEETCQNWKLSNVEKTRALWLVQNASALDGARMGFWPDLQQILVHSGAADLINLQGARTAVGLAEQADLDFCRERLTWPLEKLDPAPLVTGDDLITHGVAPGRQFKMLLESVRTAQLQKEITTRDEALALVDRLIADKK